MGLGMLDKVKDCLEDIVEYGHAGADREVAKKGLRELNTFIESNTKREKALVDALEVLKSLYFDPLRIAARDGHYEHNRYKKTVYYEQFISCKALGFLRYDREVGAKRHFYVLTELGKAQVLSQHKEG